MNWSNVKWILGREIRDQSRDRRTLFVIAVLPLLLYPLLGMSFFQISQFLQERPTSVWVLGARSLADLPPLFENQQFAAGLFGDHPDKAQLLQVQFASHEPRPGAATPLDLRDEATRLVQEGKYDAALYFPPDFGDRLAAFREAIRERAGRRGPGQKTAEDQVPLQVPSPEIIYSTAHEKSQIAFGRLNEVLRAWTEKIGESNLEAGNVPIKAARPFELAADDIAGDLGRRGTAVWSKVFPILLLIWAMTGAFYPAVDLCAGEKERGTLETLLSSPAERSEIVVGKLLTIMLFSMGTAMLNVISMAITGWAVFARLPGIGPPPLGAVLWMPVALVPISALFSALCLAMAAFARSTKEGQYYLVPLLLVIMPLVILPMAPGVELNLGNSLIPVTGVVLLLRAVLDGNYWHALQFATPVILVTLGGCLLAVRWAVDQFNSESVLFRESERFGLGLWIRRLLHERQPTPTVAGAVLCGTVILLVRFFMGFALSEPSGFHGLMILAMVTQLVVILTPALLMTVMFTSSPAQTLLLRRPSWSTAAAAALLAVAINPAVNALAAGVLWLYPVNEAIKQFIKGLVFRDAPWWQALLVFAAMPAVCEELAFRGFILSGFRRVGHKWRAIVYSAVFFGLSHAVAQQSIVSCLLGIPIGLLAVQSGSILPCIIFHVTHNSLTLLSAQVTPLVLARWPILSHLMYHGPEADVRFCWPVVALGALASSAILLWLSRLAHPKSAEEELQEIIQRKSHEWVGAGSE